MNRGLVLAGAAGLVLVLICLSWSARHPGRPGHIAHALGGASALAPSAHAMTRPGCTAPEASRLLPFPPEQITQAARLACVFVAAYSTHRYDQSPAEYVHRLEPMMSPSLRAVIERAAEDPAVLVQRQRAQEVSVGEASTEAIRSLGPTSITFLITATEHITTTYASRQDTTRYAVTLTLTPTNSDGWTVYDIELAATGQAGDSDGDTP